MNQQDTFTQRVAAVGLVIALLAIIAGVIYLAANDKPVESALTGALGLLVGALLPSPITKAVAPASDVNVTMPSVMRMHPEDIAKIRGVTVRERGRGQKGAVGWLALFVVVAVIVLGGLIIWAIVK